MCNFISHEGFRQAAHDYPATAGAARFYKAALFYIDETADVCGMHMGRSCGCQWKPAFVWTDSSIRPCAGQWPRIGDFLKTSAAPVKFYRECRERAWALKKSSCLSSGHNAGTTLQLGYCQRAPPVCIAVHVIFSSLAEGFRSTRLT